MVVKLSHSRLRINLLLCCYLLFTDWGPSHVLETKRLFQDCLNNRKCPNSSTTQDRCKGTILENIHYRTIVFKINNMIQTLKRNDHHFWCHDVHGVGNAYKHTSCFKVHKNLNLFTVWTWLDFSYVVRISNVIGISRKCCQVTLTCWTYN